MLTPEPLTPPHRLTHPKSPSFQATNPPPIQQAPSHGNTQSYRKIASQLSSNTPHTAPKIPTPPPTKFFSLVTPPRPPNNKPFTPLEPPHFPPLRRADLLILETLHTSWYFTDPETISISLDPPQLLEKLAKELTKEVKDNSRSLILKTVNWLQEQECTKILLENVLESLSDLFDLDSTDSKITPLQKKVYQYIQRVANLSDSIGAAYLVFNAGSTGPDSPLHLNRTSLVRSQDEYFPKAICSP